MCVFGKDAVVSDCTSGIDKLEFTSFPVIYLCDTSVKFKGYTNMGKLEIYLYVHFNP